MPSPLARVLTVAASLVMLASLAPAAIAAPTLPKVKQSKLTVAMVRAS